MKKLILIALFLPFLVTASTVYRSTVTYQGYNGVTNKPTYTVEYNVPVESTINFGSLGVKTQDQLFKELHVVLLKLRVELLKLQVVQNS